MPEQDSNEKFARLEERLVALGDKFDDKVAQIIEGMKELKEGTADKIRTLERDMYEPKGKVPMIEERLINIDKKISNQKVALVIYIGIAAVLATMFLYHIQQTGEALIK